jgi:hypothetical protein
METHDTHTGPSAEHEVGRAHARRVALGIQRPASSTAPADGAHSGQWALALSGGGIRSATFCLGVLQGMAKIADPGQSPGPGVPDDAPPRASKPGHTHWPLLAQFDFLSTVSGGGYIGGFFSSLFVRGRLSGAEGETSLAATERAYQALQEEPPGRIHRDSNYNPQRPGSTALAWLRDNGRYMAPSGTGDLLYDATIAIRNWFATQYVIASLMMMLLSTLQAVRWALSTYCLAYSDWESQLLHSAQTSDSLIWWSPSWALSGIVILLATLPLGIAYWYSHPVPGQFVARRLRQRTQTPQAGHRPQHDTLHDHLASPPLYWTPASLLGLMLGLVLSGLGWLLICRLERASLGQVVLAFGASTLLSVAWYLVATARTLASRQDTITLQRVTLTRWLTTTVQVLMVAAGLAAIETVAQTAWLWLSTRHGAVISGVLAVLVWALQHSAQKLTDDKPTSSWFSRVPTSLIAGVIGAALWIVVAAALDVVLLKIDWPDGWANPQVLWDVARTREAMGYALGTLALSTLMACVVAHFPGFLNLSTLQSLYSARLIRAYLGATNHARFTPEATGEARDVAEPIKGDSLSVADIHRNPLAPIHFVNVCMNQSVSPGEQLIQRDRKGRPLVVAPGGVYLDQNAYAMKQAHDQSELAFPLSFGEWLGVSGAAFSTGLGKGTALGMSLALGFANVRLGRWWAGLPQRPGTRLDWFTRRFPTQAYLLDEMRGLFYGDHRPYQYLSDGGHFENTAVYELLRTDRQRQIRVIVVCDCGCDPDYKFADLANLTRLVRIDHGLEIKVNAQAPGAALLNQVFARPEDFKRGPDGKLPARDGKCAILLDVVGTERSAALATANRVAAGELFARIILIKPRLLAQASVDLDEYQSGQNSFPQETTMDQFFDEAQWESYRQLGLRLSRRVFTADGMPGYPEALWHMCMDGLPA